MTKGFEHNSSGLAETVESYNRALTVADLAKLLCTSRVNIYRKVDAGVIPYFRLGDLIRFDPRVTARWLRETILVDSVAA